jgi:hypothetical protein
VCQHLRRAISEIINKKNQKSEVDQSKFHRDFLQVVNKFG